MNIGGFLKRNAVAIVAMASFSGCSAAIVYPVFRKEALVARNSNCQSQLKQIGLACLQYEQDNDGKYPPLSGVDSRGWSLLIQKYNPNIPLHFSCPEGYKSSFSPSNDYFFNAQLATRADASVQDPALTIAFGDGPDNGPTNSHYWELPNDEANEDSPLNRHIWGGNYTFADGHVKSIRPTYFSEWDSNTADPDEWHYKMAPAQSAFRPKTHPTSSPMTRKGRHQPTRAAPSDKAN